MIPRIEEFLGRKPTNDEIEKYSLWKSSFIEYNSHTNLMSKNEIPYLFEKHVLDSLSICRIKEFKKGIKLLDVGAGGGFPSLILAVFNPEIEIFAIESIRKKTIFLSQMKDKLELKNFTVINNRAENIAPLNVDIITNRAVGKIEKVWSFSKKHLKIGGVFVSYKSNTSIEEANEAIKLYKELKEPEIISYRLPLEENYKRELVILKRG